MTSPEETRIEVNKEFLSDVVGWDKKHLPRYLKYIKRLPSLLVGAPYKEPLIFALEALHDSIRRDREEARFRGQVLSDVMLAAHAVYETPENMYEFCTESAFERMIESLTQGALRHRISEKVRLAAAACFAKPGEIASVKEMEVASLIERMQLSTTREIDTLLARKLGSTLFETRPISTVGMKYPFPVLLQCASLYQQVFGDSYRAQEKWHLVPNPYTQHDPRGLLFERKRVTVEPSGGGWVFCEGSLGGNRQQVEVWPTEEAIIFHRTFAIEKQMLEYELKLQGMDVQS